MSARRTAASDAAESTFAVRSPDRRRIVSSALCFTARLGIERPDEPVKVGALSWRGARFAFLSAVGRDSKQTRTGVP
jgi:hypothetical protein